MLLKEKGLRRQFCDSTTNQKGTLFHNRKTPEGEIIECRAMITEGMRISSISRVKGIKEDTILNWIRSAGAHAEEIEAVLLAEYELSRGHRHYSLLERTNPVCSTCLYRTQAQVELL